MSPHRNRVPCARRQLSPIVLILILVLGALGGCGADQGDAAFDANDVEDPALDGAVAPGSPSSDADSGTVIPTPDASTSEPSQATSAPAIVSFHTWDDEIYVVMPRAGCFEARAVPGTCTACMTKVTVASVAQCAAPAGLLRARIAHADRGVVVTNPVVNTGVSERAICDAELGFQRRFGMSEQGLALAQSRGYAPRYRELSDDRLSTVDFATCLGDAAPRLRAAFYPWSD